MKTKFVRFLSFIVLMGAVFACQNDSEELEQLSKQVSNARSWFDQNRQALGLPPTLEPVWENAILHDGTLEVSFTISGQLMLPRASGLPIQYAGRQKIQLVRASENYEVYFVSYIPSLINEMEMAAVNIKSWEDNFSGKIIYQNRLTSHSYVEYVVKGEVLGRAFLKAGAGSPNNRTQFECEFTYVLTDWYRFTGQEWEYHDTTTSVSGMECYEDPLPDNYDYGQWADTGGGGGIGDPNWNQTTQPYDCIVNQVEEPCLNQVVDHVFSITTTSTLNNLIQEIFNSNENVNLIVLEGTLPSAYATTTYSPMGDKIDIIIMLDPSHLLANANEVLGATLYHEGFHAVVQYLSHGTVPSDDQHVAMFTHYLTLLSDALQTAYPNMIPGDSKGLILQHLIDRDGGPDPRDGYWTTDFVNKVLSFSGYNRSQIETIRQRYQAGASGTHCN